MDVREKDSLGVLCPVCLELYSPKRPARLLRLCGHDLCEECLRLQLSHKAFFRGVRCPSCRTPILDGIHTNDHVRIFLKGGATAELFLDEYFPKSYSLTNIAGRIELSHLASLEDGCNNLETTPQTQCSPKSGEKSKLKRRDFFPRANDDHENPSHDNNGNASSTVAQAVPRKSWSEEDERVEEPQVSIADGLEDLNYDLVRSITATMYRKVCHIIKSPLVFWRSCTREQRTQLLAMAQGIPPFAAAMWFLCTRIVPDIRISV